jgi:hypothetical protein
MAQYHNKAMAELAHQLQLSPVRLRLRQFDAAEYLVDLLEAEKDYPYDFVCHHLTGYRPKGDQPCKSMRGESLVEDVVQLIEDLSATTVLPVGAMRTPCWTTEELSSRLKVHLPLASSGPARTQAALPRRHGSYRLPRAQRPPFRDAQPGHGAAWGGVQAALGRREDPDYRSGPRDTQ